MSRLLKGQVCQLHYDSGGILEYQSLSGKEYLRFSRAPLFLAIGQEVCFQKRCLPGWVDSVELFEAVDLQVLCSVPQMPQEQTQKRDLTQLSKAKPERSGGQIQRLQRRIALFRNAGHGEQLELVLQAESLLNTLVSQSELDGNAICRLVRKCASWLNAPVLQTSIQQYCASSAAKEKSLQWKVRKILITALSHLDLHDSATRQAVETALCYMSSLVQRLDEKAAFLSKPAQSQSWKQWLQLRGLLEDGYSPVDPLADPRTLTSGPPTGTVVPGRERRNTAAELLCFEPFWF